jgi:hypothetical protein
MRTWYSGDWFSASGRGNRKADVEVEAIQEILLQASKNDCFEYLMG